MTSYFDEKVREVGGGARLGDSAFVRHVAEIEEDVIRVVSLCTGDREFPDDLRERIQNAIALLCVGTRHGLAPRPEPVEYLTVCRCSELLDTLHGLFHELAGRRITTRFGILSDNPEGNVSRRDGHDAGFGLEYAPDYGGAFDGTTVSSDADSGL